jgi:negative regulator of flagellin synthesis FlgM
MASEINGFSPRNLAPNSTVDTARGRGEARGEALRGSGIESTPAQDDDALTLSTGAAQLREMGRSMAETTPFDQEKVDRIKDLISQGEYQIDANRIAEKLREFEGV